MHGDARWERATEKVEGKTKDFVRIIHGVFKSAQDVDIDSEQGARGKGDRECWRGRRLGGQLRCVVGKGWEGEQQLMKTDIQRRGGEDSK